MYIKGSEIIIQQQKIVPTPSKITNGDNSIEWVNSAPTPVAHGMKDRLAIGLNLV